MRWLLPCIPLLSPLLACHPTPVPPVSPMPPPPAPITEDGCPAPWTPSLQGQFRLTAYPGQDTVGPNGEVPLGMSKEYTFTEDRYTMEGYPPLTVTGRYTVMITDGPRLRVLFWETIFDGQPTEDNEQVLTFSRCGEVMELAGMTYTRIPSP